MRPVEYKFRFLNSYPWNSISERSERKWLQRLNTDYEKAVATSYLSAWDFLCKRPKESYISFPTGTLSCLVQWKIKKIAWVYLTDREIFYYEFKCCYRLILRKKIHSNIILQKNLWCVMIFSCNVISTKFPQHWVLKKKIVWFFIQCKTANRIILQFVPQSNYKIQQTKAL